MNARIKKKKDKIRISRLHFIHYGSDHFDPDIFNPIRNMENWDKPAGGFWASPIGRFYGWYEWNRDQGRACVMDCTQKPHFTFHLKRKARVYIINSHEAANAMPKQVVKQFLALPGEIYGDFEKLRERYDAVLYLVSRDYRLHDAMYTWDCDSLVVMNKDVVVEDRGIIRKSNMETTNNTLKRI